MSVQAPGRPTWAPEDVVAAPPPALRASGVGRRLLAHLVDLAAVAALGAATYLLSGSPLLAGVVAGEVALGMAVWEARHGRTLGKSVLGIRAAQVDRPFAPGLRRASVRALLLGVGHLLALLGQFGLIASARLDRSGRGQGWHDRLAGTTVLDVRPGAPASLPPAPVGQRYAPPGQQEPWQQVPPPGWAPPQVRTPDSQQVAPPGWQPRLGQPDGSLPPPAGPPAQGGLPPRGVPAGSADASGVLEQRPGAGSGIDRGPLRPSASGLPEHTYQPQPVSRVPAPAVEPSLEPPGSRGQERDRSPQAPVEGLFVLTLDDGRAVTVTGPGLLGRRPAAPEGESYDHLVQIDDPGRSLSRTHARFGIDERGRLWVEDRGSANGTVVVAPDGIRTRAFPGKRVVVPEEGRIELGERVIEVQRWDD